jgi:hypothetical protein
MKAPRGDPVTWSANSILHLDPQGSSAYILLSNIYAELLMQVCGGEVSEMRKIMKYNKLRKEPGCSWIEVKDEVHTFLGGDMAHPRCKEIYKKNLDLACMLYSFTTTRQT